MNASALASTLASPSVGYYCTPCLVFGSAMHSTRKEISEEREKAAPSPSQPVPVRTTRNYTALRRLPPFSSFSLRARRAVVGAEPHRGAQRSQHLVVDVLRLLLGVPWNHFVRVTLFFFPPHRAHENVDETEAEEYDTDKRNTKTKTSEKIVLANRVGGGHRTKAAGWYCRTLWSAGRQTQQRKTKTFLPLHCDNRQSCAKNVPRKQ